MPTVHIGHHFFGAGNFGDDFIMAGFLAALPAGHDVRLTCCIPHDLASQRRRFPEIDWRPCTAQARDAAIAAADAWLGLGGSPFQSDEGSWLTDHLNEEARMCRERGVPMHFLGVGVNDAAGVDACRAVIAQAAGIWTRDAASARLVPGAIDGADLAHPALAALTAARAAAPRTAALCLNYHDDLAPHAREVERLLAATPSTAWHWLVQEVRRLPRAELALLDLLTPAARARLDVAVPDYQAASCATLLAAWPSCEAVVTSRYHAALMSAWRGARVGVVAINEKLRGQAEDLGLPCFDRVDEVRLDRLVAPDRALLDARADRARAMVAAWLAALPRPRRAARPPWRHLAVISADSLGDLVLRQPLLSALLDAGHRVTIATRPETVPLLPFLDPRLESLPVPVNPYRVTDPDEHRRRLDAFTSMLRDRQPDALLCPAYNRTIVDDAARAACPDLPCIGLAPGVPPPFRAAEREALLGAADDPPPLTIEVHVAERDHETWKAAALLEMAFDLAPAPRPRLTPTPEATHAAADVLDRLGLSPNRYVIACPVGGANVSLKAVPPDVTMAAARHLREAHGLPLLLVGVEDEREALEALQTRCPDARLHVGGDLPALLGLTAAARLYFGGDTGPMHVAAALGLPVAAVFGGGTWPRFTPAAARAYVAVHPLDCFGCAWSCRYEAPRCLLGIDARAVVHGLEVLLGESPRPS